MRPEIEPVWNAMHRALDELAEAPANDGQADHWYATIRACIDTMEWPGSANETYYTRQYHERGNDRFNRSIDARSAAALNNHF
jgi:hypothetical protein